jgi:hypothetical protein
MHREIILCSEDQRRTEPVTDPKHMQPLVACCTHLAPLAAQLLYQLQHFPAASPRVTAGAQFQLLASSTAPPAPTASTSHPTAEPGAIVQSENIRRKVLFQLDEYGSHVERADPCSCRKRGAIPPRSLHAFILRQHWAAFRIW